MVVIHAGFVKTATSTLQRGVFGQHEGIDFLGLPAPDGRLAAATHAIAKADSTGFDLNEARSIFQDRLARGAAREVHLLSYENFTLYESRDKGLIARRLQDIFGDCKIIFTMRRQGEMVAAWYLQKLPKYILGNNFIEFDDWLKLKMQEPHKSILGDLISTRRYGAMRSCSAATTSSCSSSSIYGRMPRVSRREWPATSASIRAVSTAFSCGRTTIRRSRSASTTSLGSPRPICRASSRAGGRLIPRQISKRFKRLLERGPRVRAPRSEALDAWIAEHCRSGNRALNTRYGDQLARYGYAL